MKPAGSTAAVHLPLLLSGDELIPLYLQVVHQLRHLITSRAVAAGDRLPSVRDLAQQLGVNPGTVALAYRSLQQGGLIESRRGLGTFVAEIADDSGVFDHRQQALCAALDELLDRADALGFDANTVKQCMTIRSQRPRRMHVVVVMPLLEGARKCADLIAAELPPGTGVQPHVATLAEVEAGDQRLLEAYEKAYFTFTFVAYAPAVAARLAELGITSEVVGMTGQPTPTTSANLSELDPAGKYSLVGASQGVDTALDVLARFSPLDLGHVSVFTELSSPEKVLAQGTDVYIHTFSAGPLLDALGIREEKRLELACSLSDEARASLRRIVGPAASGRPRGNVQDNSLDA